MPDGQEGSEWSSLPRWPVGVRVALRVAQSSLIDELNRTAAKVGQTEGTAVFDAQGIAVAAGADGECVWATTLHVVARTAAGARQDAAAALVEATAAGEQFVKSLTVTFHPKVGATPS